MARITRQKQRLYQATQEFTAFFNAEELHRKVARHIPGLATIYRFLNSLENSGEIHAFLCNHRKIYSLSKKNHAHFTCEVCGAISHVALKNVDFLKENIPGKACHFQIDITGICEKCLKKDSGKPVKVA